MRITLAINNNKEIKVLPVVRVGDFTYDVNANNQNYDSVKYGQIKVMGKPALTTFSIESFFPSKRYPFVDKNAQITPNTYIEWLKKCVNKRKPVRVVITNKNKTIFNELMAIETFTCESPDQQGDIAYSLSMEQYIKVK